MDAAESLKLTAYFGERKRSGGRLVASTLLDLFGRHGVANSILLRGVEGFGLRHHLRTDSLLSLSEDLPAVAIAVDRRERIEGLLAEAADVVRSGLMTLERARLVRGGLATIRLPEELHEATKVTVHLARQERIGGVPAFAAVCELLHASGVSGASTLLGVDGTRDGQRVAARFFARNSDVPVIVVAVGSGERIARVLPELNTLLPNPLVTLERVRVCKRDGTLLAWPHPPPGTQERGLAQWQKLTVFTSESALHDGRPIHRAIVRRLRRAGASGATTVRGIWGFHGDHPPHGDRVLQLSRRVPVLTTVIDTPERIAASFAIIDELTAEHGLVTSEMVPAMRTRGGGEGRGGLRMAR